MKQIHDNQYSQFTPNERLNLTLAALSRADETEANRLWETCPRHRYEAHDFEYTLSFNALMILNSLFFEMCVSLYNQIKRIDEYTLECELEFANKDTNQSKEIVETINMSKNTLIASLKGLFVGFKEFCKESNLDYENVINLSSIIKCCNEIDLLLNSTIKEDTKQVEQVKHLFLTYWNI